MSILTNLHARFLFYFYPIALAFLLIAIGVSTLFLWWEPQLLDDIKASVELYPEGFLIVGIGIAILGLFLLINLISWCRKKELILSQAPFSSHVDQKVIEETLSRYLSRLYPANLYKARVQIKKEAIHLFIELPKSTEKDQKMLSKRMEAELSGLFSSILGYNNELHIAISFTR